MQYIFKNKFRIIFLTIFSLLLIGCSYKETITQSRDIAYLKFNKSSDYKYLVIINDKYNFTLDNCIVNENNNCFDENNKLFEISSGVSTIKIFDNKKNLIINKEIYVGSNNTMEITLP